VPDEADKKAGDASGGLTPAEREERLRRLQEKQERDAEQAKSAPPAKTPNEQGPTPPPTKVQ
jgi:hypothetical protein